MIFLSYLVHHSLFRVGVFLGKKTVMNYSEDLTKIMQKILLVSHVAALAQNFEEKLALCSEDATELMQLEAMINIAENDAGDDLFSGKTPSVAPPTTVHDTGLVINSEERDQTTGGLTQSQQIKVAEMLGSWEEPDKENWNIVSGCEFASLLRKPAGKLSNILVSDRHYTGKHIGQCHPTISTVIEVYGQSVCVLRVFWSSRHPRTHDRVCTGTLELILECCGCKNGAPMTPPLTTAIVVFSPEYVREADTSYPGRCRTQV
jgi:hypothetical protein